MKLALVAITDDGVELAERIKEKLCDAITVFIPRKIAKSETTATCFSNKLGNLVEEIFSEYDGLIMVMALGIVMRVIAPHIKDKYNDPAVVVVDDVGRFVISALSGHEGGANKLAYKVASVLNTDAVITTGTESKKDIVIGIGCKRGVDRGSVKEAIMDALKAASVPLERVRLAGTVDLKADEQGLLSALDELDIPLRVV